MEKPIVLTLKDKSYRIDEYDPIFFLVRDLLYDGAWEVFAADMHTHPDYLERIHKLKDLESEVGQISGSLLLPISVEEILEYFEELNLKPSELWHGVPDGFYELAQDKAENESLDEAIKLVDVVIETWPEYAKAYELKGSFLTEMGKLEEGIEFLKRAIKMNPTLVEAYAELGQAFYNLEDYEEAIKYWEKELEYTPHDKFAYFMIADAYRKMGKVGSALETLKRFAAEDKKNILVRYELMQLYEQLGDYDSAKEYENQILDMTPYYPGDIEPWAKVFFKNGRYEDVMNVVEEHIQKYPIDGHFRLLLVVPYAKLGNYDKARKILEEFKNQKDWYFYGKKELFESNLSKRELALCGIE